MQAFYHIYQVNGWRELVAEQLGVMRGAGLLDALDHLTIGVDGTQAIDVSSVPTPLTVHYLPGVDEAGTLRALRDWAIDAGDDCALYLHTKGITHYPSRAEMTDWRHLMEYFCVERWRECVDLLGGHGAVGVNYMDECHRGFFPHFSGNFWWATAAHVRGLDHSYLDHPERLFREFWIGAGSSPLHEVYHSGHHYHGAVEYSPTAYRRVEVAEGTFDDEHPTVHWPRVEIAGRLILDLGAGDFGRIGQLPHPGTVEHWLNLGAARVVAVDMNEDDLARLSDDRVQVVARCLQRPEDIAELLKTHRPDVVKVDIEGAEELLLGVDPVALRIPATYLIEAHNRGLHDRLIGLLRGHGYALKWLLRHATQSHISVFCVMRS